ncbi:hypothetical protein Btru_028763 [Bulinus truncatus]|nr:hypothetical protein Btru_028763 [Bulinus truncatus]
MLTRHLQPQKHIYSKIVTHSIYLIEAIERNMTGSCLEKKGSEACCMGKKLVKEGTREQGSWCFTFLSITIISVCCVVGAIVIPNMERVFYNHILQFLVALAVGAMSGDALLHLFPHALMSESHHADHHHRHNEESADHTHNDSDKGEWKIGQTPTHMAALYKGLIALMGMYAFFFLERFFTHFTKHRSMKKKKKRGSWTPGVNETKKMSMLSSTLESVDSNVASCDAVVMVVHPNKALKAYADVSHEALLHSCDESLIVSASGCDVATCSRPKTNEHCHSHKTRDFRNALSSVAMMVIVADIIFSFCSGLAIGTAYAGNTVGGISTSVAVFCHELPHEIGDLAVLTRSGLTMKRAICFNLLSTLPSFFGAIIGLLIGNLGSASVWIFAGAGGIFLYITLVNLKITKTTIAINSCCGACASCCGALCELLWRPVRAVVAPCASCCGALCELLWRPVRAVVAPYDNSLTHPGFYLDDNSLTHPGFYFDNNSLTNPGFYLDDNSLTHPGFYLDDNSLTNPGFYLDDNSLTHPGFYLDDNSLTHPGFYLDDNSLTNPGFYLDDNSLTNPGFYLDDNNLTNPGFYLDDNSLTHPGFYLDDNSLTHPGFYLDDNSLTHPGFYLDDNSLTNPGFYLDDNNLTNPGFYLDDNSLLKTIVL